MREIGEDGEYLVGVKNEHIDVCSENVDFDAKIGFQSGEEVETEADDSFLAYDVLMEVDADSNTKRVKMFNHPKRTHPEGINKIYTNIYIWTLKHSY